MLNLAGFSKQMFFPQVKLTWWRSKAAGRIETDTNTHSFHQSSLSFSPSFSSLLDRPDSYAIGHPCVCVCVPSHLTGCATLPTIASSSHNDLDLVPHTINSDSFCPYPPQSSHLSNLISHGSTCVLYTCVCVCVWVSAHSLPQPGGSAEGDTSHLVQR